MTMATMENPVLISASAANNTTTSNGRGRKETYLVTGASRGLGKGLIAALLQRPNTIAIACVRDISTQGSALRELPHPESSSLIVVQLDCSDPSSPEQAARELCDRHGVTHLDVVIANAAVAEAFGPASTMPVEQLRRHMEINAFSVLLLFQAVASLLRAASTNVPKFVLVGAPISTITTMEAFARAPLTAYGVSKLAACYLVRRLHFENKWLVSFVIDPGHVQTDMGAQGARLLGRKEAPTTVQESVDNILTRINEANRETTSGQFILHQDGSRLPW